MEGNQWSCVVREREREREEREIEGEKGWRERVCEREREREVGEREVKTLAYTHSDLLLSYSHIG